MRKPRAPIPEKLNGTDRSIRADPDPEWTLFERLATTARLDPSAIAAARSDWLFPAGSEREKDALEAMRKSASGEDRRIIDSCLAEANARSRSNQGFWHLAKKLKVGNYNYETAMLRQSTLSNAEWLVAYLIINSFHLNEIADLIDRHAKTVDNVVRRLKDKVQMDGGCRLAEPGMAEIARWFFGI